MPMKNFELSAHSEVTNDVGELIGLAKQGDQNAFERLRLSYLPLLESQASKHIMPDMTEQDIEDLKQEALIVFGNAVRSYEVDPSGVEFGLYAKICIENRLVSFIRGHVKQRQSHVVPLEDIENFSDSETKDIFQTMVEREDSEELVRNIKKILSDYENRVWWLYVSGMNVSGIAKKVGAPDAKSVSNAVYRIRKKLREHFSEHDKF